MKIEILIYEIKIKIMKYKKFLLSTGEIIEVPGYMENRGGYLFNNNTRLPEGLPGDRVRVRDKYHDNSGILEDYTNAQIVKFIGEPGIVVSADSVHSGAIKVTTHHTSIVKEFSDIEIPNVYGETWIKSEEGEKMIEGLLKGTLKITDVAKVEGEDYYIAKLHGGKNGGGVWNDYLKEILETFRSVHWWMIELKNDCLDDVFDMTIGVMVK